MYSDDWDPWRRYWREQERRMWDPWFRLDYERERERWDPFYRVEKERERLHWDPWFRAEKMIEWKYNDPIYRWERYNEDRFNSNWYERYLENSRDLVLRDRYESLFGIAPARELSESEKRSLELLRSISLYNQMFSRGPEFWLKLILQLGALGFLIYLIWCLLSWRPPLP